MSKRKRRGEWGKERRMKAIACGRELQHERVREGERQLRSEKESRGLGSTREVRSEREMRRSVRSKVGLI